MADDKATKVAAQDQAKAAEPKNAEPQDNGSETPAAKATPQDEGSGDSGRGAGLHR